MNSEIVIKITAQGTGQSMEASLQGEQGIPVPSGNDSGGSGRLGAASAGIVPTPSESLGSSSGIHSKQAPSPDESLSQMGASGQGLPQPVAIGEIENLGSKAESGANSEGPPAPE